MVQSQKNQLLWHRWFLYQWNRRNTIGKVSKTVAGKENYEVQFNKFDLT
jgi:hypothetical protein